MCNYSNKVEHGCGHIVGPDLLSVCLRKDHQLIITGVYEPCPCPTDVQSRVVASFCPKPECQQRQADIDAELAELEAARAESARFNYKTKKDR